MANSTNSFGQIWSDINTLMNEQFAGFEAKQLLISFGIVLFTFLFRKLIVHWLFAQFKRLASKTKVSWDDDILASVERPMTSFILILGLFLALLQLPIEDDVNEHIVNLFHAATIGIIFWALIRLSNVASEIAADLALKRGSSLGTFMPLINKSVRVFLLLVGIALVLQNFGIQLGAVLGALGIGGAAFAFAAKDTIANLYGSFALAMDRPFKVGDWIMVGDKVDGDVEEIGLRSTKVRTWPKTVLSIPNHVLANEIINNWSRMPKRRVKQVVGVTYSSSSEQMEKLVQDIKTLLKEDDGVNHDFILVNFTDFGSSSLDILVYYFTKTTAWLEYMDVRQRINCKIMKAVEANGMSIAFPTRTLHIEGNNSQHPADPGNLPGDNGPQIPL